MSRVDGWFNPDIDRGFHREQLLQTGRTQVRDVLRPEIAMHIQQCLLQHVPWDIAYREGGQGKVISSSQWRALNIEQRQALYQRVCNEASSGFQFWYHTYMMVTAFLEGRDPGLFLHELVQWLNADEFLSFGRHLSGRTDIRKADGQATCYTSGNFLTGHDDTGAPQGQIRRMAYVMSFTEMWKTEWGGLLHFMDEDGAIVETMLPRFNTMNLFLTPQMHEVSYVTPFATKPRISITGWFRAD